MTDREDPGGAQTFAEKDATLLAWAAEVLPDEHAGLVVSAARTLKLSGTKVTREKVLARLEAQGRTRRQRDERAR